MRTRSFSLGRCSAREVQKRWLGVLAGVSGLWTSSGRGIILSGLILAQVFCVFASDAGNSFISHFFLRAAFLGLSLSRFGDLFSIFVRSCAGNSRDRFLYQNAAVLNAFFQFPSSASCVQTVLALRILLLDE